MTSRRSSSRKKGEDRVSRKSPSLEAENLLNELEQLKKKFAAVRQDNVYLRTQVQRANSQLRKKEKQVQHILSIKVAGISDKSGGDPTLNSRLQSLKQEMLSVNKLTSRVRDLESDVANKDEELKLIKSSMKFTLIKELQIEAQTYFTEARRMKQLLDQRPDRGAYRGGNGRKVVKGDPDELSLLREDVSRLRRENTYLRGERELEDKSYNIMNGMRAKMEQLQHDLANAQEHILNIDGMKGPHTTLSKMVVQHEEDDFRGRGAYTPKSQRTYETSMASCADVYEEPSRNTKNNYEESYGGDDMSGSIDLGQSLPDVGDDDDYFL